MKLQQYFSQVLFDIFLCSLVVFTGVLFVELFSKGVVTQYLRTPYLLGVVALAGAGVILLPSEKREYGHLTTMVAAAVAALYIGSVVYIQTSSSGRWAYGFAIGAAILTALPVIIMQKGD